MLAKLVALYFCFAIDRGVERFINQIDIDPYTLLPYWPDAGVADDNLQAELEALDKPTRIDSRTALELPGPFHAVDNAKRRLLKRLASWKKYGPLFEAACLWFHAAGNRDSYISKCLTGDRLACFFF